MAALFLLFFWFLISTPSFAADIAPGGFTPTGVLSALWLGVSLFVGALGVVVGKWLARR